jgi:hypothetical protein
MEYGFNRMMGLLKQGQGNYEERFLAVFNQPPPKSNTYYDQVRKWNKASPALRKAARDAGRTSAGHWATFSRGVPLKN